MNPSTGPEPASDPKPSLDGYEVLVAVCGGIAAYKTAALVSALVQRAAGVTVAMTAAAQRFITPLTFEALTARRVYCSVWEPSETHDPQHLRLTEAADLIVVAPATANLLAKAAHGISDDLVSTLLLSAASPVLLAPAMNTRMWENPAVQANLATLKARGYHEIPPGEGWLACRTIGKGRMAEPEAILEAVVALLRRQTPKKSRPT